jgi:hypothetical protein
MRTSVGESTLRVAAGAEGRFLKVQALVAYRIETNVRLKRNIAPGR